MKDLARHIMVDFLPMKDFAENPLILTEGRGIYVTDVDGRRFIDGLSGTFCVNLGHGNKRLAEAASRQIERLALAAPTLGTSDRALELVKLLLEITPPQYTTVKLLSGGSEVTEAAIKMARQYWKQVGRGTKYKVLSHYRGYHGGTGHALAAGGWPGWWTVLWVTAAMVGGRTCAMAANRVIDRFIDARNPRTAGRHLPQGLLAVGEMKALAVAGAVLMFVAAWMLNPLCLLLAPLALVFLVGYHYTKRFTWLSHWVLGFTDGIAGAGGWIAVRGQFDAPAFTIWFALTTWIGGFDLIYACQDVEVDRAEGLHSVAARFGVSAALTAARVNHVLTALALAVLGWQVALGPIYWVGWLAVVALFAYEHSLVSPRDLSRLDVAFFNVNGYIALIVLAAVVLGLR